AGTRVARVDPELVAELALACRDQVRGRFRYLSALDVETSRHVDPHIVFSPGARWYRVRWALARTDWRTFRLDRMDALLRTGVRVQPRALPVADPAEMILATDTETARYPLEAVVHLDLPLQEVHHVFGVWATGATADDAGGTAWPI